MFLNLFLHGEDKINFTFLSLVFFTVKKASVNHAKYIIFRVLILPSIISSVGRAL